LAGVVYNALESRFAVCGVFYRTTQTKHKVLETASSTDFTDSTDGEVPGLGPAPVLMQENDVTESFEFVPIDSWDFYLSPVGSCKVGRADHTIERVWLTPTAILDGIRNEGFIE